MILDIMMPKLDGIRTLMKLRESRNIPVILLSAKSEDADKILGLTAGADDYVTKPFVPVELLARVRSQLRRYASLGSRPETPDTITIGSVSLDDRKKTVTVDGTPIALTPMEFSILKLLMVNPGKVFSTKDIYEAVWGAPAYGSEGSVAVHIRHIREKIEIDPSAPRHLKVVWGQGYKMEGAAK
jgi:DNA-binding response OmpR family regulator